MTDQMRARPFRTWIVATAVSGALMAGALFFVGMRSAPRTGTAAAPVTPVFDASKGPHGAMPVGYCRDRTPPAALHVRDPSYDRLAKSGTPHWYGYPRSAKQWVAGGTDLIPLQILVRYSEVLDRRAQAGRVTQRMDGEALTDLLQALRRSGRLKDVRGMVVMPYTESIPNVPAPYVSSMSQASLLRIASAAYHLSGRKADLALAHKVLRSFDRDPARGGVEYRISKDAVAFEEYATGAVPQAKLLHVLNGWLYAMHTLAQTIDLRIPELNRRLQPLYEEGIRGVRELLPRYDTGFDWSYYDLTGNNRATADYHIYQASLLLDLGCREHDPELLATGQRWLDAYWARNPMGVIPTLDNRSDDSATLNGKGGGAELEWLRAVYPHPYLSDQSPTLLTVDGRARPPVSWNTRSRWTSTMEPVKGTSLNWGQALLPRGTKRLDVWFGGFLGLPPWYRVHSVDVPVASRPVGQLEFADCGDSGQPKVAWSLYRWGPKSQIGRFAERTVPPDWSATCVTLPRGQVPSRVPLATAGRFVTGFRGESFRAHPDGSLDVTVRQPRGDGTPQDSQVLLSWDVTDLTLGEDAVVRIPVDAPTASAATFNVTTVDGKSMSRTLPVTSRGLTGEAPLQAFVSTVPGYTRSDHIKTVDVRLVLQKGASAPKILVGSPSLLCGAAGLMSSVTLVPDQPNRRWTLHGSAADGEPMFATSAAESCYDHLL